MRIYNDENGKAIDYLAERNEEIKERKKLPNSSIFIKNYC